MKSGTSTSSTENHQTSDTTSKVIDNYGDFQSAYSSCVMDGLEEIIVTEKFFAYLCKDRKSKSLTYGDPGVRVFIDGTQEKLMFEDSQTAEEAYVRDIREKSAPK